LKESALRYRWEYCAGKKISLLFSISWDMRNIGKNYSRKYAHTKGNVRVYNKDRMVT
jgi:hypothetical protein